MGAHAAGLPRRLEVELRRLQNAPRACAERLRARLLDVAARGRGRGRRASGGSCRPASFTSTPFAFSTTRGAAARASPLNHGRCVAQVLPGGGRRGEAHLVRPVRPRRLASSVSVWPRAARPLATTVPPGATTSTVTSAPPGAGEATSVRTTSDVPLDSSSSTDGPISATGARTVPGSSTRSAKAHGPRRCSILTSIAFSPACSSDRHPVLVEHERTRPAVLVHERAVHPARGRRRRCRATAAPGRPPRASPSRRRTRCRSPARRGRSASSTPNASLQDVDSFQRTTVPSGRFSSASAVGLEGRLAPWPASAIDVERLRERAGDEPGLHEPPVAPRPRHPGLVLRLRRRCGRGRAAAPAEAGRRGPRPSRAMRRREPTRTSRGESRGHRALLPGR